MYVTQRRYPVTRRWTGRVPLDEVAEPEDPGETALISEDVGEQIRRILMSLMSEVEAFIVYKRGVLGEPLNEVALEIGKDPHAISQAFSKGIKKLRAAARWHPVLLKLEREYREADASTM